MAPWLCTAFILTNSREEGSNALIDLIRVGSLGSIAARLFCWGSTHIWLPFSFLPGVAHSMSDLKCQNQAFAEAAGAERCAGSGPPHGRYSRGSGRSPRSREGNDGGDVPRGGPPTRNSAGASTWPGCSGTAKLCSSASSPLPKAGLAEPRAAEWGVVFQLLGTGFQSGL